MPPSSSRSHGAGAFLDEFFKRPQGWSYTAPSFHELLTGDRSGGSTLSVRRRVERARLANLDVRIVAAAFEPAQMVECGIAVLRVRLDHQHRDEIDGVLIHCRGATAHFVVETIGRSGRSWLLGRGMPDNPPLDLTLLDGLVLRAERKHFDDLQIAVATTDSDGPPPSLVYAELGGLIPYFAELQAEPARAASQWTEAGAVSAGWSRQTAC